MINKGEVLYLQETKEGIKVKRLVIEGYQITQLDRIEKKLDKLLNLLKDKEQ